MDLTIDCEGIRIEPINRSGRIRATLDSVDPSDLSDSAEDIVKEVGLSDVLRHFSTKEIVDAADASDLLEEIGKDACMKHFGLVEKE